jgi:cation:H+ antiporter
MLLLNILFYVLLLLLSLFILGKSASFLITAITRIGFFLRLSQFLTGFILLGVATSTPEISVAINSTLSQNPQLSLGNLIGANVVLLTLISGIAAILAKGVEIKKDLSNPGRLFQIGLLISAPLPLLLDSYLSRLDGVFLLFLYVIYIYYIYRQRPNQSPPLTEQLLNYKIINTLLLALTGIIGLFLSSKAVVFSSLKIAEFFNAPVLIVGLLILSVGTNLPEITITFTAIKKHHANLVLGDVLGSASTNTLIIAILAIIHPFGISSFSAYETSSVFLIITLIAFYVMTHTKNRLSPVEGYVLLCIYVAFLTSEIVSSFIKF